MRRQRQQQNYDNECWRDNKNQNYDLINDEMSSSSKYRSICVQQHSDSCQLDAFPNRNLQPYHPQQPRRRRQQQEQQQRDQNMPQRQRQQQRQEELGFSHHVIHEDNDAILENHDYNKIRGRQQQCKPSWIYYHSINMYRNRTVCSNNTKDRMKRNIMQHVNTFLIVEQLIRKLFVRLLSTSSFSILFIMCILSFRMSVVNGRLFGRYHDKCTLPCKNAGVCMLGKEHMIGDKYIKTNYCSCPMQYTGVYCEIKYLPCPDTGLCFNGNPCMIDKTDYGDKFSHCECNYEDSDLSTPFARQICQHIGTTFCFKNIDNNDKKNKNELQQSMGGASSSFCMNGGRCLSSSSDETVLLSSAQNRQRHKGCICPIGFHGEHCDRVDSDDHPLAKVPENQDPLFIHQHLLSIRNKQKELELNNQNRDSKHKSFGSYVLSFIVTFLLIFTSIAFTYWLYLTYCPQARFFSYHYIYNAITGNTTTNPTSSSSPTRRHRRQRRSASEKARLPKAVTSTMGNTSQRRTNTRRATSLTTMDASNYHHHHNGMSNGYISTSSQERRQKQRNNSRRQEQHHPQQQQQQRKNIGGGEIELL